VAISVQAFDEPFAALDTRHRDLLAQRLSADAAEGNLVLYTDHREQASLESTVISLPGAPQS
jgi:ABC-type transport system involved in cytochrome c biogenesis ATPase subunit